MHRIFSALAVTLLFGIGGASLRAADEEAKDKDSPAQVIRWTGSAYEDGDAFIVAAKIYDARVELNWEGPAGDNFEFLDDREQERPPRVKKDYHLTDAATVQAFKTLATQAEQCNPGDSMVIGQGISTGVVVESPPGKTMEEMSFFGTDARLVKPLRFEAIPFQVKELVRKELPEALPAENSFATSIRDLAADLSRFAACHDKLLAAYKAKGDLPLQEMEALRVPVTLKRALSQRRLDLPKEDEDISRKLLSTTKALLRDCLGPAQRTRFMDTGEGRGEGGIVFTIGELGLNSDHWDRAVIPPECLSVQLGTEEQVLAHLPKELEDVLVRFLGQPALGMSDEAEPFAQGPLELFRLGITTRGRLELRLHSILAEGHGLADLGLPANFDHPEVQARLEYLNSKGIVKFLLGHEAAGGKIPALVRISDLSFEDREAKQATIRIFHDGKMNQAKVHLVDGKWMPLKVVEQEQEGKE